MTKIVTKAAWKEDVDSSYLIVPWKQVSKLCTLFPNDSCTLPRANRNSQANSGELSLAVPFISRLFNDLLLSGWPTVWPVTRRTCIEYVNCRKNARVIRINFLSDRTSKCLTDCAVFRVHEIYPEFLAPRCFCEAVGARPPKGWSFLPRARYSSKNWSQTCPGYYSKRVIRSCAKRKSITPFLAEIIRLWINSLQSIGK